MTDKVLVTGGAGFVGSHVAEYYKKQGSSVTVLDNLSRNDTLSDANEEQNTSKYNWKYLKENFPNISFIQEDVRNKNNIEQIVEGHDSIVHTAGQVAVTSSLEDAVADFEINTAGTLNILEAARKAESNPDLVYCSTNKVYGNNINEIPTKKRKNRYVYNSEQYAAGIPESFPIDECEHTPYGVSKLAADQYVQDYARREEVNAAAFRMSCIYGPRQFGNEDQGWVAHFALSTVDQNPITIYGDGKQVRDVLYVKDLVRAFDSFLTDPEGKSTVYNIGGGIENTTSLVEFLDLIEEIANKRTEINYDEWREGDQRVYISDISRAKNELGWEPDVSFNEGIKKFISWYSE